MTPIRDRTKPWARGVRRLGHGAFGLKPPAIADLPGVGEFTAPGVSRVELPLLVASDASDNLTLVSPSLIELAVRESPPETRDLTQELLSELTVGWDVLSLFRPLRFPSATGKSYEERTEQDTYGVPGQESFMPSEKDLTEECIHGLIRSSCDYCSKKAARPAPTRQIAPRVPTINPLDLILPLLQPPLGHEFDNVVAFPVGKSLYPFQCKGVQFLVDHESALLGDEMGLGKSIQAIVAMRVLFRTQKIRKVLLLSPKSVLYDWYHKLREWAPELSVLRVRASPQERAILWQMPAHIYLTTYSTLRNDIETVNPRQFDLCLLDEIQYIKNPGAGVTQAARRIDTKIRWGLTGTPLENKVDDVVSLFAYLKPGLLHYSDADRPGKVKDSIRPYFLRRRAADVLDDLPDKVSHEVWLELEPRQREAYEQAFREGRSIVDRGRTVTHVLAQISKLKQLCNLDPDSRESCKLEYLQEQLGELRDSDEKALVFSQYPTKTLEEIEPSLSEFQPKVFHGQLSDRWTLK
jgi:hypothetical protein